MCCHSHYTILKLCLHVPLFQILFPACLPLSLPLFRILGGIDTGSSLPLHISRALSRNPPFNILSVCRFSASPARQRSVFPIHRTLFVLPLQFGSHQHTLQPKCARPLAEERRVPTIYPRVLKLPLHVCSLQHLLELLQVCVVAKRLFPQLRSLVLCPFLCQIFSSRATSLRNHAQQRNKVGSWVGGEERVRMCVCVSVRECVCV